MKKSMFGFGLIVLASILVSCVSLQDRTMTPQERDESEILGTITVKFTSAQWFHVIQKNAIRGKALILLRAEAAKKYQGKIDIRNVVINGSFNALTLPVNIFAGFFPVYANIQTILASGEVVRVDADGTGTARANQERMGRALESIGQTLIERLPEKSAIAVLSISSSNRSDSEFIVDELEYRLVSSGKFTIVDRRRLDQIRSEQNFQMSGEVDDNSAVSIGNMLGANIVLTGTISGSGTQYLSVKALDVKTAQIIAMAREQLQ